MRQGSLLDSTVPNEADTVPEVWVEMAEIISAMVDAEPSSIETDPPPLVLISKSGPFAFRPIPLPPLSTEILVWDVIFGRSFRSKTRVNVISAFGVTTMEDEVEIPATSPRLILPSKEIGLLIAGRVGFKEKSYSRVFVELL